MGPCVPLLALRPLKGLPEATLEILREAIAELELAIGQAAFVGYLFEMMRLAVADPARHPCVCVVPSAGAPFLCEAQRWAPTATPWRS